MIRYIERSLLALAFLAAACDGSNESSTVAQLSTSTLASGVDLARLSSLYEVSQAIADLSVDEARPAVLDGISESLDKRFLRCVQVTTDRQSTVDVDFDGCRFFGVELEGQLHAALSFESAACDQGECPVAVRYSISSEGLRVARTNRETVFAGQWQLRVPLDGSKLELDGSLTLDNDLGDSLAIAGNVAFLYDQDGCVRDLSAHAFFERSSGDVDRAVNITATGVSRCDRECPSTGELSMAFADGRVLQLAYTGEDTAMVVGPGGEEFETLLPCGRD